MRYVSMVMALVLCSPGVACAQYYVPPPLGASPPPLSAPAPIVSAVPASSPNVLSAGSLSRPGVFGRHTEPASTVTHAPDDSHMQMGGTTIAPAVRPTVIRGGNPLVPLNGHALPMGIGMPDATGHVANGVRLVNGVGTQNAAVQVLRPHGTDGVSIGASPIEFDAVPDGMGMDADASMDNNGLPQ